MNPALQSVFDSIEQQRLGIMKRVSSLSEEQRTAQPKKGKWSVNQIIAHLMTAEKMTLLYMQKKILGIDTVENAGFAEELKMIVLYLSQRLPLKFKAPKAVVEQTESYEALDKLDEDWKETRAQLKLFYSNLKDDQIDKKIYKHIIAGRLSAKHSLLFIREHTTHHLPQIKRLTK